MRRHIRTSFMALALLIGALRVQARAEGRFSEDFRSLENLRAMERVAQRRDFPRIVTRPDVRINRTNPGDYKDSSTGKTIGFGWFPSITRLANGELLCFFREGREHGMANFEARGVLSRSTDGGRTWQEAQVIRQEKEWAISPQFSTQTDDGSIWLNLRARKVAGEGKGQWKWMILRSTDDGHSWEQVSDRYGMYPGPAMSNGEMLWRNWRHLEPWSSVRRTFAGRIKDGEMTWGEERVHPELGPSDEWSAAETRTPGVLVSMMRQQQLTHYYATARSEDYGRTWTPWRESNVYYGPCPTRPRMHTMPDGRLIFTYGQRWIGRTFAVVSKDDGETWDVDHRQVILHSPQGYHVFWDSHYTDIARAEGDTWIAVDYISGPSSGEQKGIYGTFIDARYFEDAYAGVTLKRTGTPILPETAGYWTFDELEGEFARDSLHGNFGEIAGATRAKGRFGGALAFDGKDDHVMIYDDQTLWLPRYFTVEAWINTRDASKEQTILSKAPAYTLALSEGKPALRIGRSEATADLKAPLESNRWYHLAVLFHQRSSYARATFFVDGKEVSAMKPERDGRPHGAESFAEAVAQSDMKIPGGPMFQEYTRKNQSTDNLVIGMNNDLTGAPFDGLIDEVMIHGVALAPEHVDASVSRGFHGSGAAASRAIARPAGAKWTTFDAKTTEPEGTSVRFTIADAQGTVLMDGVAPGADLGGLEAEAIVLRAELSTNDPGQTPILHEWSVGASAGAPGVTTAPLPDQSAPAAGGAGSKVKRSAPRKKAAGPAIDKDAVRLKPVAGIPLNLYLAPIGTKKTVIFDVPYDINLIDKAWLELAVDDIDEKKEAKITLNGKTVEIHESVLGEGAATGALVVPVDALVKGRNTFEFVFADNLNETTEGYEILKATLALAGRLPDKGASPARPAKRSPEAEIPL